MSSSDVEGSDPRSPEAHTDEEYPWQHAEVLPEDRAMGLELELIELEHEREEAESEGARTGPIEDEIHEVLDELVDTIAPGSPEESHVVIDAPEAAEVVSPDLKGGS